VCRTATKLIMARDLAQCEREKMPKLELKRLVALGILLSLEQYKIAEMNQAWELYYTSDAVRFLEPLSHSVFYTADQKKHFCKTRVLNVETT